MPRLQDACEEVLSGQQLDTLTLPRWIDAAVAYRIPGFMQRCVDFAAAHLSQIMNDRWDASGAAVTS